MAFRTRQERLDASYRMVEAIYRKGGDTNTICRQTGLCKMDVLDITQKIYALDERRRAKAQVV